MLNIILIVISTAGAIYIFYNLPEWKTFTETKKTFKYLTLAVTLISASLAITNYVKEALRDEAKEYLNKNRAQLNAVLYIDKIKNDSVTFHLKINNSGTLPGVNLKYNIIFNYNLNSGTTELTNEIGHNESQLVFPTMGNVIPEFIDEGFFILQYLTDYRSIWEGETLNHNDNFIFQIPPSQLSVKEYEPTSKLTNKTLTLSQVDSIRYCIVLAKNEGTISFVLGNEKLNEPFNQLLDVGFASLYYYDSDSSIVFKFNKMNKEELILKRQTPSRTAKDFKVSIRWSYNKYGLQINNEPDTVAYIRD